MSQQGKLDEALAELRRAAEIVPENARIHNNIGDVLREQHKAEEAIAEYRRSIALDPRPPYDPSFGLDYPYFNLAQMLSAQAGADKLTVADIARLREACDLVASGRRLATGNPGADSLARGIDAQLQSHGHRPAD